MSDSDRTRWDEKYARKSVPAALVPDEWLIQCAAEISPGSALDLACGLGHNAIWLAQQGWTVDAIDVSPAGLELAQQLAECQRVHVNWIAADLDDYMPQSGLYDLVTVFRYLDRKRVPPIVSIALAPGGHLVYETFSSRQFERADNHLKNPAFALQPGELPLLFENLEPITHQEVELDDGAMAQFFARKPTETPEARTSD